MSYDKCHEGVVQGTLRGLGRESWTNPEDKNIVIKGQKSEGSDVL